MSTEPSLLTPIYLKTSDDMPWPKEDVFYLLTSDGLFLCRNHPFFRSSTPARRWPSELASHESRLDLDYPKVPRGILERIVGFFAKVGELHNAEAGALLAWDRAAGRMRVVVPEQLATVGRSWHGETYPIGLHYEIPAGLPETWTIIGDIHSHVNESAYASATDCYDESHRPGLHIVIGRIRQEPPQVHIEAVVDGKRFHVDPSYVLGSYIKRRKWVPRSWLDRVRVKVKGWSSYSSYDSGWSTSTRRSGGNGYWDDRYDSGRSRPPQPPSLEPGRDTPPAVGENHERQPPTSA